jgi:hypothetical protein
MAWQSREASKSWVRRGSCLQGFIRTSDKTDWAANEEALVVKCAASEITDFVLVDKARMNEINSGNKLVVSVAPLIF